MQTVTIEEAQAHLAEIIAKLPPGEEVVITREGQPIGRILGAARPPRPGPGLCKEMLTIVADDEEHLIDFAEYMP